MGKILLVLLAVAATHKAHATSFFCEDQQFMHSSVYLIAKDQLMSRVPLSEVLVVKNSEVVSLTGEYEFPQSDFFKTHIFNLKDAEGNLAKLTVSEPVQVSSCHNTRLGCIDDLKPNCEITAQGCGPKTGSSRLPILIQKQTDDQLVKLHVPGPKKYVGKLDYNQQTQNFTCHEF